MDSDSLVEVVMEYFCNTKLYELFAPTMADETMKNDRFPLKILAEVFRQSHIIIFTTEADN